MECVLQFHLLLPGDEAASFTKEEMQQGKHTEYEKNLHEEMINNESSSSSGGGGSHSTTTTTTTAATSGGSGTTNTLTTTNGHHHHPPNQRAPTTTTTTPGDKQPNDNSRINSNLNDNDTSNRCEIHVLSKFVMGAKLCTSLACNSCNAAFVKSCWDTKLVMMSTAKIIFHFPVHHLVNRSSGNLPAQLATLGT